MFAGCFSWCRLLTRWDFKKQVAEKSDDKVLENRPVIPLTEFTSVENQLTKTKSDESVVLPTKTEYITASGKEVLTVLQSAAVVIPVPLLQDAIGIALKIIEVCEEASAVGQIVKGLQDRVGHLMIVILDHVTDKNEDNTDLIVKTAKCIEQDIEELLRILRTINKDLTKINAQNRWIQALYKKINTSTVDDCTKRLSTALETFKLANDLRDSNLLQQLHSRLKKIQDLTQHMANKVDNIDDKVDNLGDDIQKVLSRLKQSGILLPSDTVIRQEIPLKPDIFYGRDDLVQEIAELLMKEETSRVCILGSGGMGKTSVSLAVVELPLVNERYPLGNRVWVPCIEATSVTRLLEILYIQLQVPGDKQVTLQKIISELDASKQPRLILLDNFETPWNAPDGMQKQVEDILRQVARLKHVAMLVTMRGSYPPCDTTIKWHSKEIQPADEAACLRIYHDINPASENDLDVGKLLSALGYMPFAITLMANLGKQARSTAKELLEAWSESGPDILPGQEQSMNRSISLSVDSNLVKQNPNALLLLKILSLLPAGTTKENLHWWAPALKVSMIPSAIATLFNAALLVQNKRQDTNSPVLFVLPVVQSFMQQHDRIAEDIRKQIQSSCCQYVVNHACRYDDFEFPIKSKALAAEDTNIQSILFGSPTMQHTVSSDRIPEVLIALSWHYCDTKPNPEIAKRAVMEAKASGIERYLALAKWCLGRTYHQLDNFRLSYDHLQESYQLFNTLLSDDHELQRLSGQCGIDLVDSGHSAFPPDEKAVSLARDVEAKCATLSDDVVHGRSLVFLGLALHYAQQRQEAMYHLDRAKTMIMAMGNNLNLAEACHAIARVHYQERRLPEALGVIEEAWKYAELSDSPHIQADISQKFGEILLSADRDTEALKHIETGLMKASHVESLFRVARGLESMGYGYLRRGDYHNAYGAYEAAAKEYLRTDYAWHEKRCKDNMAGIKRKEGNPDALVGFQRPTFLIEKSLFYLPRPVQVSASDVPNSTS